VKNLVALLIGGLLVVDAGSAVAGTIRYSRVAQAAAATCDYGGKPYTTGSQLCQAGKMCSCLCKSGPPGGPCMVAVWACGNAPCN